MPEFLASVNIREMNFYRWDLNCRNRVPQSDAGVRVGRRVQDNTVELSPCLLNPVHQFAFDIRLAKLDGCPQFAGPFLHPRLDFGERGLDRKSTRLNSS